MRAIAMLSPAMLLACAVAESQAPANCAGPRAGWVTPSDGSPHWAIINRISIDPNQVIKWNGVEVSRERLREYLGIVRTMNPLPFTVLSFERDVDCQLLGSIRDDMAAALPCDQGACGEGRGPWEFRGYRESETEEGREARRKLEQMVDDAANAASPPN
jgi:hypothetical protein